MPCARRRALKSMKQMSGRRTKGVYLERKLSGKLSQKTVPNCISIQVRAGVSQFREKDGERAKCANV